MDPLLLTLLALAIAAGIAAVAVPSERRGTRNRLLTDDNLRDQLGAWR